MSLYNAVMGTSPLAPLVIKILNLKPDGVPRFRDAWASDDGSELVILTRTGGNNRPDYERENAALTQIEGYKHDCDDSFDPTFAHFTYETPERFRNDLAIVGAFLPLAGQGEDSRGPGKIEKLLRPGETPSISPESPEALAANEAVERIVAALLK